MSDMQDFSAVNNEESSTAEEIKFQNEEKLITSFSELDGSFDHQSYFIGEVPQSFLVDPHGFLPLNSDRLVGAVNMVEKLTNDVDLLMHGEVTKIQDFQKKISFWEDRIEKEKAEISDYQKQIKQNSIDMAYDKKNRDYWLGRAEEVALDYSNAEAANRRENWLWLVKKYGLKNPDGTQIVPSQNAFEEICNGSTSNLVGEYKNAGNKYEFSRKNRETENNRLIREISRLKGSMETLQGYISSTYAKEIEPLQDGVLLLKELNVKLKSLQQNSQSTFGDLRAWAESFINEFIQANSRVPQTIVTEFRKLSSIPLPAENC